MLVTPGKKAKKSDHFPETLDELMGRHLLPHLVDLLVAVQARAQVRVQDRFRQQLCEQNLEHYAQHIATLQMLTSYRSLLVVCLQPHSTVASSLLSDEYNVTQEVRTTYMYNVNLGSGTNYTLTNVHTVTHCHTHRCRPRRSAQVSRVSTACHSYRVMTSLQVVTY